MLLLALAPVLDATLQMLLLALAPVLDATLQMPLLALAPVLDATLQMPLLALAHVLYSCLRHLRLSPLQLPSSPRIISILMILKNVKNKWF